VVVGKGDARAQAARLGAERGRNGLLAAQLAARLTLEKQPATTVSIIHSQRKMEAQTALGA
jgi:hypothetical protein